MFQIARSISYSEKLHASRRCGYRRLKVPCAPK